MGDYNIVCTSVLCFVCVRYTQTLIYFTSFNYIGIYIYINFLTIVSPFDFSSNEITPFSNFLSICLFLTVKIFYFFNRSVTEFKCPTNHYISCYPFNVFP